MHGSIFNEYGKDPLALFGRWLAEAQKTELNDPEAFCLATSGADCQPRARMLLLKGFDARGFKFHTHETSAKGKDIYENKKAEMCFYWKSTRKQVRITGTIEPVSDPESDEYFATRPRPRQIGAWASRQSETLESPEALEKSMQEFEKKFTGQDIIPRPPGWKGYRLKPGRIEFWIGHEHRLHTRFIYTRKAATTWDAQWLNP